MRDRLPGIVTRLFLLGIVTAEKSLAAGIEYPEGVFYTIFKETLSLVMFLQLHIPTKKRHSEQA